jgi:hypothetical protein
VRSTVSWCASLTEKQAFHKFIMFTIIVLLEHDAAVRWEAPVLDGQWAGGVHRVDWSLAETDSGMAKGLQVGFKQEGLFLLPPIDTSPPRARAAEARSR